VPDLIEEAGCSLLLSWPAGGGVEVVAPPAPRRVPLESSTVIRTTGSSGPPKLAVHALEAHLESARAATTFFDLGPEDTWLLSLPLYHVGGLAIVVRCLWSGTQMAVPSPAMSTAEALHRFAPTHLSLVPTQLRRLLADEATAAQLARCKAVLMGGDVLPMPLRLAALERGVPLVVCYGSTETAAFVTASRDLAVVRRPLSAGPPLPGREVRIAGDGEIRIDSPTLLSGYLRDGRLDDPRDADGLYPTGDVGRLDDEGVLYVEGRKDRLFISGGENVQPAEIEDALEAIAGVEAAVVVHVPHPEWGRRPVAFVAGAPEVLDGARLAAALRERLPGFKVPDAFYELPADAADGLKTTPGRLAERLRDPRGLKRL
jgi:O-succinylbenzoic acid--CoA ligase